MKIKVLHVTPRIGSKLSWGDDDENYGLTHHYLLTYLKNNMSSEIFDTFQFHVSSGENVVDDIDSFCPQILSISSLTFNYPAAVSVAAYAKKKGISVIIGGHHISAVPTDLTEDMDVGVIGEGEVTYKELLINYFKNKCKFNFQETIKGIVYRSNGKLTIEESRDLIIDLDSIGHVERNLSTFNKSVERSLFTSRGCCYNCVFCGASKHWSNLIRYHSANYVVSEIEKIYEFSNTNYIRIEDLTFTINKKRLYEILSLWENSPYYGKIKFAVKGRANLIDEEMVGILQRFGVDTIFLGFESNDNDILKYLKKIEASPETNQKAYDLLQSKGITIYGSFLINTPLDTLVGIENSISFLERNGEMCGAVYNLVPLPGTEIMEFAKEKNLIHKDYQKYIASYSLKDIVSDNYIHLASDVTKDDLITCSKKIQSILQERGKSNYVHQTKFRK